jgi:hypothetical protein
MLPSNPRLSIRSRSVRSQASCSPGLPAPARVGAICLRARQPSRLRSRRGALSRLPDVHGGGERSELQGGRLEGSHRAFRATSALCLAPGATVKR